MNILQKIFGRKKKSEDEEEMLEVGKKKPVAPPPCDYEFKNSFVRLIDTPFAANSNEVIFTELKNDQKLNDIITENYDMIKACFAEYQLRFIYIPLLWDEMKSDEKMWRYQVPFAKVDLTDYEPPKIYSDFLLHYMYKKENIVKIAESSVMRSTESRGVSYKGISIYNRWEIRSADIDDVKQYFTCLAYKVARGKGPSTTMYNINYFDPDRNFDEETENLIAEVKYKIDLLRRRGVSDVMLGKLTCPQEKLSRLFFTGTHRIFLTDYENKEVVMTPLVKAVYILFINHPEGIMFKELIDYRDQLTNIYYILKGKTPLKHRLGIKEYPQSIIDLTDPTSNSINEKCARIKEAFLKVIPDYIAENYYITGKRGEPKKVKLPLNLLLITGVNC